MWRTKSAGWRHVVLGVLLAFGSALASCGDDDGSSDESEPDASTDTADDEADDAADDESLTDEPDDSDDEEPDDSPNDDSPNDDSPNDDSPNDDSPNDDSPNDDSPNDDEDAGTDEPAPSDDTTAEDDNTGDDEPAPEAGTDEPPPEGGGDEPEAGVVSPPAEPSDTIVTQLLEELDLGRSDEPWVANVTRTPLADTRSITPVRGSSTFTPSGEYSFAFLDLQPRQQYEHDTQFVFAEAGQPLVVEDQGWWPELDGVGFVVSDVDLVKLFSPETSVFPEERPYPGGDTDDYRRQSDHTPIIAVYPDYENDTGEFRLFFYSDASLSSGTPTYVNLLVDLDGDGQWGDGERLITNLQLPSAEEAWRGTPVFTLPTDEDGKFSSDFWTRVSFTTEPIPEGTTDAKVYCDLGLSISYGCTDEYYDFSTWSGSDCDSEWEGSDCSGSTITFGPQLPNPPVPEIEGAPNSFICQPDELVIPTVTKALVINMGDTSGRTDNEYTMNKVAALFSLHYGDEGVAKLNHPTAERALEAIRTLVSELECLDEAHIYLTGHGAKETGELWFLNGYGGITREQLHDAITSSNSHCPSPLDYGTDDGCRIGGYCNLSLYFTSCYSGLFLEGEHSLQLPGLNVLTSASSTNPAYVNLTGFAAGERVGHAFVQGFVDNQADAAPYGNEDGVTSPAEARRWAQLNYDDTWPTEPQLWEGEDCNCNCANTTCGNGEVDPGEECDASATGSACSIDRECNPECQCECTLTEADCGLFAMLDAENCECDAVPTCPVSPFDLLITPGSVVSDNPGAPHSAFFDFLGAAFSVAFTPDGGTFSSEAVPTRDVIALDGTMVDDLSGCIINGSGVGTVANNAGSNCDLVDFITDGVTGSGQYQCCPSSYPCPPNEHIVFDFTADVTVFGN